MLARQTRAIWFSYFKSYSIPHRPDEMNVLARQRQGSRREATRLDPSTGGLGSWLNQD
jgi:hypothetical protein